MNYDYNLVTSNQVTRSGDQSTLTELRGGAVSETDTAPGPGGPQVAECIEPEAYVLQVPPPVLAEPVVTLVQNLEKIEIESFEV